jgi:LPXTG-motif cell wall-anchored protein
VQANGFTNDGKVRSMNLGVVVPALDVRLPATGTNTLGAAMALLLAAAGAVVLLAGRRRSNV